MQGKLYLIPSTIGDSRVDRVLPPVINSVINKVSHYIVENERTARRFLIKAGIKQSIDDLKFFILNKHTSKEEISDFIEPLKKGTDMGVISEAGLPAIADPGSEIVKMVHLAGAKVVPLTGPSSIFLALMASGLNGQNFAFNGYLPIKKHERVQKIKFYEQRSRQEKQSQIFIEAPYRNQQLFHDIIESCNKNSRLCIATDITLDSEFIKTQTMEKWKRNIPELHKRPCIFILSV